MAQQGLRLLQDGLISLECSAHPEQTVLSTIKPATSENLIECNTDYIPSDIPAAPATGSIESLVLLGALAGADDVTIADTLPIARGNHMLMSFRYHPTLGLISVCQMFATQQTYAVYVFSFLTPFL